MLGAAAPLWLFPLKHLAGKGGCWSLAMHQLPHWDFPVGTKSGLFSSSHCRHHPHCCLQITLSLAAVTSPPAPTPSSLPPQTPSELPHLQLCVPRSLNKENKTNRVHFLCKTNGNKLKLKIQSKSLSFCPNKCNKGYPGTTRGQKIKLKLFPAPAVHRQMSPLCSKTHGQFEM